MGKLDLVAVVLSLIFVSGNIPDISALNPQLQGRLLTPEQGCGISKVSNTKIVGGTKAKPGAFPWIALIGQMVFNEMGILSVSVNCGGALITSRHVLTAAHCISPSLFVRLGEHDLTTTSDGEHQDIRVIQAVAHPNYNSADNTNDIAVLTLQRDVEFDDRVRPVCLLLNKDAQRETFVGTNPFVAGWGRLGESGPKSNVLMQVQMPVLENKLCEKQYRKAGAIYSKNQFSDLVLCAGHLSGGQDTCVGDSGGPLMIPNLRKNQFPMYQIGVISYGIGCARPNAPGVYTRVSQFMDWIMEQIN